MNSQSSRFPSLGSVRQALVLLITVALIPVLVIQAGIYVIWFRTRTHEARMNNLEMARGVATAFRTYVDDITREEAAIAAAIRTKTMSPLEMNNLLALLADEYPEVRAFNVANDEGKVMASSDPGSVGIGIGDRSYFQALKTGQEYYVSELLLSRAGGEPAVFIARALRNGNQELQLAVVAEIYPTFFEAMAKRVHRAQGTVSLFDQTGRLVFSDPPAQSEDRDWTRWDPVLVRAIREKGDASGVIQSPLLDAPVLTARVYLPDIAWVAGAGDAVRDIRAPLLHALFWNVSILVLTVALSLLAALMISRRIVAALHRLQEHTNVVGSGRLDHRVQLGGFHELDQLARTFNVMAERLEEQRSAEQEARRRLEHANRELESFAYSVSHDLRTPLRSIDGFSAALLEDYYDKIDDTGRDYLTRVRKASQTMGHLIDDILRLSRASRTEMAITDVDLSRLAVETMDTLRKEAPDRRAEISVADGLVVRGDERLLRVVIENLLGNAWKFTRNREIARIEFGVMHQGGERVFFVRDNGAGFDMAYAGKLFGPFQRLHTVNEFPGTGIGLATVQRIIFRHGGRVWAQSAVDEGATFFFTLG